MNILISPIAAIKAIRAPNKASLINILYCCQLVDNKIFLSKVLFLISLMRVETKLTKLKQVKSKISNAAAKAIFTLANFPFVSSSEVVWESKWILVMG